LRRGTRRQSQDSKKQTERGRAPKKSHHHLLLEQKALIAAGPPVTGRSVTYGNTTLDDVQQGLSEEPSVVVLTHVFLLDQ
jgi:hypothetical protein